jgi:hypothetical protein
MYNVPVLYKTRSYLVEVAHEEIEVFKQHCRFRNAIPCDADVYDLCCSILHTLNLAYPGKPDDGLNIYMILRQHIRQLIFN